jgi:hypothetical protein
MRVHDYIYAHVKIGPTLICFANLVTWVVYNDTEIIHDVASQSLFVLFLFKIMYTSSSA